MNNLSKIGLAALLATTAAGSAHAYNSQLQQAGDISYITGGIGDEERDALKAVKNDYNLSIVNSGKSGAYVGDARVVISNRDGQPLVDADAGPLFYAQLPPGKYMVEGESEGQSKKQAITISENKATNVHFTW